MSAAKQTPERLPYAVVANAGLEDEFVVSEHATAGEAYEAASGFEDADTDVMRRRADGSLTTEF